jgi:hypothetical protein
MNISVRGEIRRYKPGDWVNIGRQVGQAWVDTGVAYVVDTSLQDGGVDPTAGIIIRGSLSDEWRSRLGEATSLSMLFVDEDWRGELPFVENLIWRTSFDFRLDLLLLGFQLLDKWQLAVPLWDYTTLAEHVGTAEDRELTRSVIRDLRVPLRDTRLLFVKRCDTTTELIRLWREGSETGNEQLAFLRALYTTKPLVCDLPASWTGREQ